MAAALQCSDRATLERFFTQGGSANEIESLASHLEQCTRCGEMFDELLRQDNMTIGLLQSASALAVADSPAVKNLCDRLARIRPATAATNTTAGMGMTDTGAGFPGPTPIATAEVGLSFLSAPQKPDEIGRLGTYRILKKLGAGGMGIVFLAEDTMLQRKVALKTMLPSVAVNPQARERFLREARAAAAIEHAHIITIHQVGEDNGVPFLAMPLLSGESLEARLAREKRLPIADAVRITCEMADGLAAAHAQGLIHRDIKPGNVWLEEQFVRRAAASEPNAPSPFKVKVLDFGLARAETDEVHLTQSGAIIGTPAFMAPEQARGESIDARADLFSLGCVLYVMLTGQRPFTGPTTMALLTSLAVNTPKSPRELNPAVPAALSDFTMRLLAKSPEDRPPSAEAALDELRKLVRPTASPTRRRRVALLAGLALLFLIGGGFAAYQLFFKTKDGTLIVEVDGDADVRFQKGELRIFDTDGKLAYTLKPNERNKTLPPGKYLIEVAGAEGLKLVTDKFEIVRDGKAKVVVTVDAAAVATKEDTDPDRKVAEWVLSNGGRLTVWFGDKRLEIANVKDLPAGPFQVAEVGQENDGRLTAAGLEHLKLAPNIQGLVLNYANVSDDDLAKIKTLNKLSYVGLNGNKLTDSGLQHLKTLTNSNNLGLANNPKVGDAGLAILKNLTKLQVLALSGTGVTDVGLKHLYELRDLNDLYLEYTKVTADGVKKLAAALPNCQIVWDKGTLGPKK